jgi:hypothetical protein
MSRADWIWMPHPAHFICAEDCRFHLATYVSGYIVSTVGEYFPDSPAREIIASCRGIMLKGQGDARRDDFKRRVGWVEIGSGRTYETMVFKAEAAARPETCCPWRMESPHELETVGYNDPIAATVGHMRLCEKFSAD